MKIVISPRAEKQLKKLSKINQIVVSNKIVSLGGIERVVNRESPKGYKNIFRVRVGDMRVVYKKTKREIYIVLIGHRREVYDKLKRLLK